MIVQLNDQYRVEDGWQRKVATATEELLKDNVTAKHYQVGSADALGRTIELGKSMTYLDYLGDRIWYMYQYGEMERVVYDVSTGERKVESYEGWKPVGTYTPDEIVQAIKSVVPTFNTDEVNWSLN